MADVRIPWDVETVERIPSTSNCLALYMFFNSFPSLLPPPPPLKTMTAGVWAKNSF